MAIRDLWNLFALGISIVLFCYRTHGSLLSSLVPFFCFSHFCLSVLVLLIIHRRYSKSHPDSCYIQLIILLTDSFPLNFPSFDRILPLADLPIISSSVSWELQSLVQAFDGRYAELSSAIRSLQIASSNNGCLPLLVRKIRPRDVDATAELQDLLFSKDGFMRSFAAGAQLRSETELHRTELLQSHLKRHEELKEVESFLKLLSISCARILITKSYVNEVMRENYSSFASFIESIDDTPLSVYDHMTTEGVSTSLLNTTEPELTQLQTAVECIIIKHVTSCITTEVMKVLHEGLGKIDWIRNSSFWHETVLHCMVSDIQYDCVRDDVHRMILGMVCFLEFLRYSLKKEGSSEI